MPGEKPPGGTQALRTATPIRIASTSDSRYGCPVTCTSANCSAIAASVMAAQSTMPGKKLPTVLFIKGLYCVPRGAPVCRLEARMILLRQLFDPTSSTYTYLVGDPVAHEAVLIDPVFEHVRRDSALVRELELKLLYTLETHVHADHVTGAWLLRQRCGSQIAVAASADTRYADRLLRHGDRVTFGSRQIGVRATPGHTNGFLTFV